MRNPLQILLVGLLALAAGCGSNIGGAAAAGTSGATSWRARLSQKCAGFATEDQIDVALAGFRAFRDEGTLESDAHRAFLAECGNDTACNVCFAAIIEAVWDGH